MKTGRKIETLLFVVAFALGGYLAGSTAGGSHHGSQAALEGSSEAVIHTPYNNHRDHSGFEITTAARTPSVQLMIHADPVSGWNLHVMTKHFTFAPERAGKRHVDGEGHGHLYIDDQKVARLYGPWFHIAALEPGEHEIRVSLNTNLHEAYLVNGQEIDDRLIISGDQS